MKKLNIKKSMLITIISFWTILLLLMPSTKTGVISVLALSIAGCVLCLWRKWSFERKKIDKASWITALFPVILLGTAFYSQWFYSYKVQMVASLLHLPAGLLVLAAAIVLSLCSVYFTAGLIQLMKEKLSGLSAKYRIIKDLSCCLAASGIIFFLSQNMIDVELFPMGIFKALLGILLVSILILWLYGLFGEIRVAMIVVTLLCMVIFTVNVYVFYFRGRLFEPVDVFTAKTVMNVADNYNFFPFPTGIVRGWRIWSILLIGMLGVSTNSDYKFRLKNRVVLIAASVPAAIFIWIYAGSLQTFHWQKEAAMFNGYLLDFVAKVGDIYVAQPEGYSDELIAEYSNQYAGEEAVQEGNKPPHIIVIMNEAFADLDVIGEINTNQEVTPFISSLKDNTISGYALSSVWGGNTANAEYEFLTGNSMAWLAANAVPYQQYVKSPTYSIVSYLKTAYQYNCVAMHPYLSNGWERVDVYDRFGFDEALFIESFPQQHYIGLYISDREMFEKIVETYENNDENPLFLFGVSMQNHGAYIYNGGNYVEEISLVGYDKEYPETEQYLSLIHYTDKAVEYLISYFENVDEDVIIVMFGDHQPKFGEDFYEEVAKNSPEILAEPQNRYKIPFFIWANYDMQEEYVEGTSLNYLSSYIYKAAGMTPAPYNRFLIEMEDKIPQINANGFYSLNTQEYMSFDEATEEEKEWMDRYRQLQYNSIFGGKKRDEALFPIIE